MRFSVVLATALAGSSTVFGHSIFASLFVNGDYKGPGIGKYIRGPPSNSPVKDTTSKDIICNVNNSPVAEYIEVSAGDELTAEWFHNTRGDDIIDLSHKGPVIVYVAPASTNGEGAVWTKIWEEEFTNQWAVEKLVAASGHHTVTVPDLKSGDYLLRAEIIALHESDTDFTANSARGAQFYMSCAQIRVVSSGSVTLGSGINFQTDYKHDSPGILFDLYGASPSSYIVPGGGISSIAAPNQRGIGAPPPAGSKPTTVAPSTSAVPTGTTAPATSASPITTTSAGQPTTTIVATSTSAPVVSTTSRPPIYSTSKMVTVTIKPTETAAPTPSACPTGSTGAGSAVAIKKYYQCGGIGYTGSTTCEAGSSCVVQNPYYSQCL